MKYLNLLELLRKAHVWWLKRELEHHMNCLETYLGASAFDLDVSPHDYRKRCELLRGRIRDTASKLLYQGVDVFDYKDHLKWR